MGRDLCDERQIIHMAAQLSGREGKIEKWKKMEKSESDEEVEKKQKVMVEEYGDR